MPSKTVVLCPNTQRDKKLEYTLRAASILKAAGHSVLISPLFSDSEAAVNIPGVELTDFVKAVKKADLLVTLGGDGTILHAARAVITDSVPIVGVNLGHLGFLAELETNQLELLTEAADGNFSPSLRMMLDVELLRDGQCIFRDTALNDAVIVGVINTITVAAAGDGHGIFRFAGDGIVAATPTGSTAYSLSAGGPLVEPTAENIVLTPICAHMLAARSFVLEPERLVTVSVEGLTGKRACLSVDGEEGVFLSDGDVIRIKKSGYNTMLAHVSDRSFYEIVFEKLVERK